MEIRRARGDRVPAIAELYVSNQKEAYRGLLSDEYLNALTPERAAEKWAAYPADGGTLFLAEESGALLGFAACKRDETLADCLYLDSLHVAAASRGRGVGRALIARVAQFARESGLRKMSVCVVRGNDRARALYVSLGARHFSCFTDDFGGTPSRSEKLLWDELPAL